MKRGDFVVLKRRPAFRGMVLETWGPRQERGCVFWENGSEGYVTPEADLLPGKPFTTAKLTAALNRRLEADRAMVEKVTRRAEWLEGLLTRPRKRKV